MTSAHTLRNHATSEARGSDQARGPTITARLDDGPLQGMRIEAQVVEGRPPSTVDVPADDSSTCRYCLAEWAQERSIRDLHVSLPRVVLPWRCRSRSPLGRCATVARRGQRALRLGRAGRRRRLGRCAIRRRFAPHQLRHARAVELAREGVPLNVIQRQLGRANLGTTSILYITLLCAGDERSPSRFARVLSAAPLLAA
jgi:hypothetical protein